MSNDQPSPITNNKNSSQVSNQEQIRENGQENVKIVVKKDTSYTLVIFLFLLLIGGTVGAYVYGTNIGTQEGYDKGLDVGYTSGYDAGFSSGFTSGNIAGYDTGYNNGNNTGFTNGRLLGYSLGQKVGYEEGFLKGNSTGYGLGDERGYKVGYVEGNVTGYLTGKDEGFSIGYTVGVKDGAGRGTTLHDPSFMEMLEFLRLDKTDQKFYSYPSYVCHDFASDVKRNAFNAGLKCFYVTLDFPPSADGGHAIVAFNTTDRGMQYVEPQSDQIMSVIIGQPYWDRSYYDPPTYDDTIVKIDLLP